MDMKQKILLLDDNKDLLLVLQIILKGRGYQSVTATSIDEAVSKIKVHKPELILMDVHLSDQDSREFCSQLKHDSATSDIRVIMMSGDDNDPDTINLTGADDYLQKPFNYDDLLNRVERQVVA